MVTWIGHLEGMRMCMGGMVWGKNMLIVKTILDLINDGVLFVASIDSCNRLYLLGKSLVVVIMMHL